MKNKASIFISFILILSLNSCIENISPSWQTNNTFPVITGSLDLSNVIVDSNLFIDSNMFVHYKNYINLYEFEIDSLVNVLDTVDYLSYNIPFSVNVNPGQNIINLSEEKNFDFKDIEINTMKIKSGKLSVEVLNTVNESVICEYSIYSATKNGNYFHFNELIDQTSSTNNFTDTYDISGYTLDMLSGDGLRSNTMTTQLKISLDQNANAVTITPLDSFSIYLHFEDIVIDYLIGNISTQEASIDNNEVQIDITDIIKSGNIELGDIKGDLVISNGLGLDASVKTNYISSVNTSNNQNIDLYTSWIGNYININRSRFVGGNDTIIPSILKREITTNDNINDFIENLPDKIKYDIDLKINPLGNISGGNDYIYSNFPLKVGLDIDALLSLKASGLCLADTIAAWDNVDMPENLGDIKLKIIIDNGYPIGAHLSISFLDEYKNLIENFIIDQEIIAATTDINFFPNGLNRTILFLEIPQEKAARILDSKSIALKTVFDTDNKTVNITKESKINISIIANFDYKIQL